jgi:Ca2+-binding RTX toxin-like protein
MSNGSGDLTFDYTDSILTGSSDTQVLNVSGLGTTGGTFAVDATIESLTIKSTGSASTLAAVTATGATKISVNATAALTITGALSTAALTVDASSSTAGVSLAATGAADYTITGGSGNDTVDIGNELTTADSLIGGAGVDTLVVTDSSDIVADLKVSGFETVRLSEAGQTADLQYLSGITTIAYRAGAANSTTAINVAEGTAVLIDDDATTLTHTVKDASNAGVTNSVTVTIDNDTDETDIDIGTAFVAAGVETLSFVSRGITSPAAAAAGSENSIASLVGSTGLVTVNASGASDFEITSTGAIATLTAVNAAGMTGRFTVTNASTATARTTITGGSGADTITGRSSLDSILGGAGNDTIDGADGNDYVDGGAGVDSITGGTGNDTILGGDGNDTIDSETGVDNVSGGAGDDVFLISATYTTNLTSSDTISGGDGTDTLRFTTAGDTAIQLVTNSGILTNVSGIDRIGLGAAAAQTLTINDLALSVSDGSSITVIADTNQAHAVVASGVLNSAATVGFIMGSAVTNATTLSYTVGNAKDRVIFGVADGAITATNMAFLSATDTITGGSTIGDVLSITDDNALTISTATAGHRLAGVTSVETISIDTTDGTATADYVITLDNTFVAANYDSTNAKFTISRGAADTGDTDVLGGAVTGYNLDVTGGAAADTITGGSGNDTLEGGDGIDTVSGGAGNDRIIGTDATDATDADNLTGGQGNDTFVYDVTPTGVDVITDFQLPSDNGATLASVLDTFELDGLTLAFDGAGFNTVLAIAAGATLAGDNDIAATDDVIILGNATYATLTAMATDLAAGAAAGTEDAIVFWADTFGTVHLAYTTDRNTAASAVDVATLSGISITGVATVVTTANIGMFDVA